MKASNVLTFIILCILTLGLIGIIIPEQGIKSPLKIKFIHPKRIFFKEKTEKIDLNTYINLAYRQFKQGEVLSLEDSLKTYTDFTFTNPSGINYPNNDLSIFDKFFEKLEKAKPEKKVIRIIHYGDSQIEGDRISGYLREQLQQDFGGLGPGLLPAIQIIPSASIRQNYTGNMTRYAGWGPDIPRASHRRYGFMGQMIQVVDGGTINFSQSGQAYQKGKEFTRVKFIFGENTGPFSVGLTVNGNYIGEQTTTDSSSGVKFFVWNLKTPAKSASLSISGTAEIYGISLDGDYGIAVDNIPMRGASGTTFSNIEKTVMRSTLNLMDVGMIILQFGGNAMPAISGQRSIEFYAKSISNEIRYFKEICPEAVIMFIGPSDMSRNIDGEMKTWPMLPELNEALKDSVLKNGGAYWDMFNAMGGKNSMPVWVKSQPALASTDYIHFTLRGAQKISEMIHFAIYNDYAAFQLRKKIEELKADTVFTRK